MAFQFDFSVSCYKNRYLCLSLARGTRGVLSNLLSDAISGTSEKKKITFFVPDYRQIRQIKQSKGIKQVKAPATFLAAGASPWAARGGITWKVMSSFSTFLRLA